MKRRFIFLASLLFLLMNGQAQSTTPWNGHAAAVVLTYDDAISQHIDNALPVLDSLGLKATFYITGYSASVKARMPDWKKVAAEGHELGNHTLYHPCVGGTGREWVRADYDLRYYTVPRMVDEIRMNNMFLQALDGKTVRTFAFPCGDMKIHDSAFMPLLKSDFIAARAVREQLHTIDQVDLFNVDCYAVNGQTAEQMKEWVRQAINKKALLVILFHGVGGGNSLNVELTEHRKFLQYLKTMQQEIWIAPMVDIAQFIKQQQH